MLDKLFSPEVVEETLWIVQNEFPLAIWETIYVTIISTAFAVVLGLPLGVLLMVGEKDGVLPLPKGVMHVLNVVINLLRFRCRVLYLERQLVHRLPSCLL